ncbi:MAG: hypothetical protein HY644_04715 [Acidobacteria bacterium]|nr:hypothetical protein [Acidobacteriota bacterium]
MWVTPEERFEKIERQLEFLANQQTLSLARVERHQQEIERHSEQIAQLGDFLLKIGRLVEDLTRRTDERFRETDERFRELTEIQKRTDERLNILIGVVERYFSNGGRQ